LKARLAEERLDSVKSKAREMKNELKKAKSKDHKRESVVTDTGNDPAKREARERASEPDKAETVTGKEAAMREARLEIEVPTKETYRVTRVISKDEVPFKKFRYTTNSEPRHLASYVLLMTKYVKTADQLREYENIIAERALMGDDGESLEDEETVESGEQNDDTDDDSDDQDGNDRGEQHGHDSGEHDDTDDNNDQEYIFEHYYMDGKIDSDKYHNDTDNDSDSDNYIDKDRDDEESEYDGRF